MPLVQLQRIATITRNTLDRFGLQGDRLRAEAELLAGVQSEDMRIVMPNGVCFASSGEDVLAFQTNDYNTSKGQGCLIQIRVK